MSEPGGSMATRSTVGEGCPSRYGKNPTAIVPDMLTWDGTGGSVHGRAAPWPKAGIGAASTANSSPTSVASHRVDRWYDISPPCQQASPEMLGLLTKTTNGEPQLNSRG